jgi:hypothetical protein
LQIIDAKKSDDDMMEATSLMVNKEATSFLLEKMVAAVGF